MKLRTITLPILTYFLLALTFACPAHAAPHTVKLTWTAPVAQAGVTITGYKVYRGTATGAEGVTAYGVIGNVVTFTDTVVTGGVSYFYKVTATATCDAAVWDCSAFVGESAASNEAATGAIPLPQAPVIGAPTAAAAVVQ